MLFAPACTHRFFASRIKPALSDSTLRQLHNFLLDDDSEQGDVAGIYRKSLLYLVWRSFESRKGSVPILGREKYLKQLDESGFQNQMAHNVATKESEFTASASYGGFDNDAIP